MDLNNMVSDEDIASVGSGSDDAFDSSFDDLSSLDDSSFGDNDPFGDSSFMDSGLGDPFADNPFNDPAQQQQSALDKLFDNIIEVLKQGVLAVKATLQTIPTRTEDELGLFCLNSIKGALVLFILGVAAYLIRLAMHTGGGILGPSVIYTIASFMVAGAGFIGVGISAIYAEKADKSGHLEVEDVMGELPEEDVYEEASEDILNSLFEDEDENEDAAYSGAENYGYEDDEPEDMIMPEMIDYDRVIEGINSNLNMATRSILLNTFIPLFRSNTPEFANSTYLDPDSREFASLNTLAVKALAKAAKKEVNEINSSVNPDNAVKSIYSYEFSMPRVKGLNKPEDIEREIVAYFSEGKSMGAINSKKQKGRVTCMVKLEGDNYRITLVTGESALITYGDLFKNKDVLDFYKDTSNKLPFVAGINELGQPVLVDAKSIDSMLVAGQPRSGKSWHVLNIILSFLFFNPPEDVQMLIIDPKASNLFKTVAMLPHVLGLHDVNHVLPVFKEIIEVEAERRKKLLADNYCDTVWDLREKGIKVPVLYIVIDEVITITNELGASAKEFNSLLTTIITQLPSLGIKLILIPHRATGVIDKTSRANIHYSAAVRATDEVVKEVLDIKKWTVPLQNPGDTALKIQDLGDPFFVRGVCVAASDFENTSLIEAVAKVYYKLNLDIEYPEWLTTSFTRNEEEIQRRLYKDKKAFDGDVDNIVDVHGGTDDLDSLYS